MFMVTVFICAINLWTSCDGPYREEVRTCGDLIDAEMRIARTQRLDADHHIIATCDKKFANKDH